MIDLFEEMRLRTFLLAGIGVFIGTGLVIGFDLEEPYIEVVFNYIVFGFFPIIWINWQLNKQTKTFSNIIHTEDLRPELPQLTGLFISLFAFSLGAAWLSSFLLSFPFPNYVEAFLMEEILPGDLIPSLFMIIYISIIGPIAEELFFRGILLKRLAEHMGMNLSVIITSVLFGILHFDLIGAFIFGLILALLYLHTKSLLIPILFHIVNNSLAMILIIFKVPTPDFLAYETVSDIQSAIIPNIILLIIATPALLILMKKYRHNDYMR